MTQLGTPSVNAKVPNATEHQSCTYVARCDEEEEFELLVESFVVVVRNVVTELRNTVGRDKDE